MFTDFTVIDANTDPRDLTIDALIEPSIDAFEFSVPSQSRTDTYAVWIRYRLRVYDSNGDPFANWPLSAYGKSEQTGLTGEEPLKRAAVLAMRDAAALMIMKLDKATSISTLKDRPAKATVAVEEEVEAPVEEKEAPPERREFVLPPPGPASGPAELSMDPEEDEASGGLGGNDDG